VDLEEGLSAMADGLYGSTTAIADSCSAKPMSNAASQEKSCCRRFVLLNSR